MNNTYSLLSKWVPASSLQGMELAQTRLGHIRKEQQRDKRRTLVTGVTCCDRSQKNEFLLPSPLMKLTPYRTFSNITALFKSLKSWSDTPDLGDLVKELTLRFALSMVIMDASRSRGSHLVTKHWLILRPWFDSFRLLA